MYLERRGGTMKVDLNPGTETRVPKFLGCLLTFNCVSIIFVAVRVWVRTRHKSAAGMWWDDWVMIAAQIFTAATTATLCLELPYGMGRHAWDIPEDLDTRTYLKIWWHSQWVYFTAAGLIRASILIFYLRLATWLRNGVYVTLFCVIGSTISFVVVTFLQCTPIQRIYEPLGPGTCIDQIPFWLSASAVGIVLDLMICILPMRMLWAVRLPKRQRLGLMGIFAIGAFVCLTSILRLHSVTIMTATGDSTWDNVECQIWSMAELNVGIMCACLPAMKPLFGRFLNLNVPHVATPTPISDDMLGDGRRRVSKKPKRRPRNYYSWFSDLGSKLNPESKMSTVKSKAFSSASGTVVEDGYDMDKVPMTSETEGAGSPTEEISKDGSMERLAVIEEGQIMKRTEVTQMVDQVSR